MAGGGQLFTQSNLQLALSGADLARAALHLGGGSNNPLTAALSLLNIAGATRP
jgi:hypothetical protein